MTGPTEADRQKAREIVGKVLSAHAACDDAFDAVEYVHAALTDMRDAERKRAVGKVLAIKQIREHEAFRGLSHSEDADGWRDLTSTETLLLKSAAREIEEDR